MAIFSPTTVAELIQAILDANSNGQVNTIELDGNPYVLIDEYDNSGNGLPVITGDIIINGNGSAITRDTGPNTPEFRIMDIGSTGKVNLNDLTLSYGRFGLNHTSENRKGAGLRNQGTATLTKVTVANSGYITFYPELGGGIFNAYDATMIINESIINNNYSESGGGIGNSGSMLINQSTCFNNNVFGDGGGIYNGPKIYNGPAASLTIIESNIHDNSSSGSGGGLFIYKSTAALSESLISNNTNTSWGAGGIGCWGEAVLTVSKSIISDNNGYNGGGIHGLADGAYSPQITISECVITNNHAINGTYNDGYGGGIYAVDAQINILDSEIAHNSAVLKGGGIYSGGRNCTVKIEASVISNNTATVNGGAILQNFGTVQINYCQIFDNSHTGIVNETEAFWPYTIVDALYNWWGEPDGPSGLGADPPGSGDSISTGVIYKLFWTATECNQRGPYDCELGMHAGFDSFGTDNPISLYKGEKRLQITDLSLNTPVGPLSFTRTYRQSKQADWQSMGLGWTHNHIISLSSLAGTPNTIVVRMPHGGEAHFTEQSTNHYVGDAGATSIIDWDNETQQYTLTTVDQSVYTFDGDGKLRSRSWPDGETWMYSYDSNGLTQVADDYGNKLIFRYANERLYRVGDQTFNDIDPENPTGRYIEFAYTPNKIVDGDGAIVDGPADLLTCVFDMQDKQWGWLYRYYAEADKNADIRQLNFLIQRESPSLDETENGRLITEKLAYMMQGTELAVDGGMEMNNNSWTGIVGAEPVTNEQSIDYVDEGFYSRHVYGDAADKGIESQTWNLVKGLTYIVKARVYPVSGTVRMQVPGQTDFYRDTGGSSSEWQTLRMVHEADADVSSVKLQFIASGGAANFYVDAVSIVETDFSVEQIVQERGEAAVVTAFDMRTVGTGLTTQTIAGTTTKHRFVMGVPAGTIDPMGNAHLQWPDTQFRLRNQIDANGNSTQLTWSADGKHLDQVTDALEGKTAFEYDGSDRLWANLDAEQRQTVYVYDSDCRQPTLVLVGAERVEVDINGDMENDSGWSDLGTPIQNERSTDQVYSGHYSRYVEADDGDGIESAAWTLETRRTYVITAHVYLKADKAVKMAVTGSASFDVVSSTAKDIWRTLRIIHTVTESEAGGCQLQFLAQADGAQFYVDAVGVWIAPEIDVNGGMELDGGWSDVGSPTTPSARVTTRVDSGTHSRHVVTNVGAGIESTDWPLETNQDYVIWARVYAVSGTVRMQVPGITPAVGDKFTTEGSGTWETLTITYTHTTSPETKRLQFLADGGSAEFYVDSVSVVTNGEIDVKGNMELDDPNSGWLDVGSPTTPSTRSDQQVDSGNYSRLVIANSAEQGIENDTPFTLIDDQVYTVRARVYVVDGVGGETVKMCLMDGSDQIIPDTDDMSRFTNRWETLSCAYRPNGTQTGVQLQFLAEGGAASFYVDTVSVRLLRELADPINGVIDGEMETDTGWSGYNNPSTNMQSVRVDSGTYFRYGQADNGQGIKSDGFDLIEGHTYIAVARIYLATDKVVKMTVTGSTSFDAITSTAIQDIGRWQTLQAIHEVTASEAGSQRIQFLAQAAGAEFYVDTVHLLDLGIVSEARQDQVRWQEFTYDNKRRTLEEWAISPRDAKPISQVTRTYHALGSGAGLPDRVSQHDVLNGGTVYTDHWYDNAGRIVRTRQGSTVGSCTSSYTVFDSAGNVLASICNYDPGTKAPPVTAQEAVDLYESSSPDDNRVTTYEYDTLGRRVETTAHAGADFAQSTRTIYDALGRVVRTIDNYKPYGTTDPADWEWVNGQWEDGSSHAIPHGEENNENLIAHTTYNALSLVRFRRDVLGNVVLYGYDNAGRLVKTVQNAATPDHNNDFTGSTPNEADPSLSAYPYAPNTSSAAPDQDIITGQVYDAAGNLVESIDPLGNLAVTIYDALNRPVATVRNPSNPYYPFADDPELDNYTFSTDPESDLIEKTSYDLMGRVQETQRLAGVVDGQAQWATTHYVYDDLDRPVRTIVNYVAQGDPVVDPAEWLWNTDHWEYSAGNDVDHGENDLNLITHTEYGEDGRVLWTRDPAGQQTWHVYDGFGRQVLAVANYSNENDIYKLPDQWTWEDEGRVWKDDEDTEIQHGDNSDLNVITQTFYDADGGVTRTRDTRGSETRYAYDTPGRQVLVVRNFFDDNTIDTDISQWHWNDNNERWEDKDGLAIPRGDDKDRNVIAATSYDQAGRVSATRNAAGAETRSAYDISGRRTLVVRNFYDDGYIDTDVSQWLWNTTEQQWEDGSGVPIPHGTDFDQNLVSTTTYDLAGRVASSRDVRGTQTAFVYDAVGRQQQVRQAAGSPLETVSYTCYNKAGQVLRTIANWTGDGFPDEQEAGVWTFAPGYNDGGYNDRDRIVEYTYDALGRRVKAIDPVGNVTVTAYDKAGQVDTMTDPEDVVSLYRYDQLRRRILVVQNYVAQGNPVADPADWAWVTDHWEYAPSSSVDHGTANDQNVVVQVAYDLAGRKTSQREPNGSLTVYRYDQLGRRITQVTNYQPQGSTDPKNWHWDGTDERWERAINDNTPIDHGTGDENAFITQTTYEDLQDNGFTGETRVTVTKPDGTQTTRDADRLGRSKSLGYGDAASTFDVTFEYDAAGNRVSMTENNGTSDQRITGYEYDQARRLTRAKFNTDGLPGWDDEVTYEYGLGGQRTKLTLPGDLSVTYSYDLKGRLVSLTDWDGHQTRFAHDNANRLIAAERASGLTSHYRYDAAGRLRKLRHTHGAHSLAHFAYEVDKRGNRTRALELLAHPATTNDMIYAYDDTSIAYQGTWAPDAATYMKSEGFSASLQIAFFGSHFELTVGTGVNHAIFDVYVNGSLWRSFDGYAASSGELTVEADLASDGPHILELRNRAEHSLAAQANANYDETNFIVRFKQLLVPDMAYDLRTLEYTYDALSRLVEARYNPGINVNAADGDLLMRYHYAYDQAGNRTQTIVHDGIAETTTSYSYNAANQLTGDGTFTYEYDANGNLHYKKQGQTVIDTYTWDRANRLTGMGGLAYVYDGAGNRISQSNGVDVTQYLLDLQPGLPLVVAQTKNGVSTDRFVHLLGRGIFAQEDNTGTWQDLLLDGLGSTRMVVDDTVSVDSLQSYAPYGESLDGGMFGSPFTFTGELLDANDLLYLRARYYNPALGIFTALDPFENLNHYQYVGGNVVNATDPSGMLKRSQILEGTAEYSCHCGWIDWTHAGPRKPDTILQSLSDAAQLTWPLSYYGIPVDISTERIGSIGATFNDMAIIPAGQLQGANIQMQHNLAAGIWMSANWEFELAQGNFYPYLAHTLQWALEPVEDALLPIAAAAYVGGRYLGIPGKSLDFLLKTPKDSDEFRGFQISGFSEEDLVSDLIGFYMASMRRSEDDVREICGSLGNNADERRRHSLDVWEYTYGGGSPYSEGVISMVNSAEGWRQWTPRLLNLLDCTGNIDRSNSALGNCNYSARQFPNEILDIAINAIPPSSAKAMALQGGPYQAGQNLNAPIDWDWQSKLFNVSVPLLIKPGLFAN